jgi:hypothetical protein
MRGDKIGLKEFIVRLVRQRSVAAPSIRDLPASKPLAVRDAFLLLPGEPVNYLLDPEIAEPRVALCETFHEIPGVALTARPFVDGNLLRSCVPHPA